MRTKQLIELGIPEAAIPLAIEAVQALSAQEQRNREIKLTLAACVATQEAYVTDPTLGRLAV